MPKPLGRIEDRRSRRHFDFALVDGEVSIVEVQSALTLHSRDNHPLRFVGQTWRQVSQRVHFCMSIVCRA